MLLDLRGRPRITVPPSYGSRSVSCSVETDGGEATGVPYGRRDDELAAQKVGTMIVGDLSDRLA